MGVLSFPKLGLEFNLTSTAFTVFGLSIQWYGIIIGIGFLLAMMYVLSNARKFGLHPDRVLDVLIGGVIGGIIGARLYYVIFHLEDFTGSFANVFNIRLGGLAIYGGIIGGIGIGALVSRWRKVKFPPMLDLAGLGFFIGQSIGRWGNFVNMEAFGSNTDLPWGMTSATIQSYLSRQQASLEALGVSVDPTMPVHPCFLYESLWCLLGFLFLHLYKKKRKFDGELFIIYASWYGLGRFFIEGLRTDSLLAGNLRVSQVLSALVFIAGVILWFTIRGKVKRANDPNYLPLYVTTEESKEMLQRIDDQLSAPSKKKKTKKGTEEEDTDSETDDGSKASDESENTAETAEESAEAESEEGSEDKTDEEESSDSDEKEETSGDSDSEDSEKAESDEDDKQEEEGTDN